MISRNFLLSVLSLAAVTILFGGCFNLATKDAVINKMIRGGEANRDQVIRESDGMLSDYKVYRDGTADGVVFDYVCVPNFQFNPSDLTPAILKAESLQKLLESDSGAVLKMGIYTKIRYVRPSGEVLAETKITSADL